MRIVKTDETQQFEEFDYSLGGLSRLEALFKLWDRVEELEFVHGGKGCGKNFSVKCLDTCITARCGCGCLIIKNNKNGKGYYIQWVDADGRGRK